MRKTLVAIDTEFFDAARTELSEGQRRSRPATDRLHPGFDLHYLQTLTGTPGGVGDAKGPAVR